jgi:catechol 2,3-dioxygenase-like lactoylglutathione lyase family enzyme
MDMKLELIVIPVNDVDRAKAFYVDQLGFKLEVDSQPNEQFRIVQATPVGSGCSIAFGIGIGEMPPGTMQGMHLVVPDIEAALAVLRGRGVTVDGPFHFTETGQTPGLAPGRPDYGTFASINDPDGNVWLVQEIASRGSGWRLEVVILPVADVDRSKAFYSDQCGFAIHNDHRAGDTFRVVQADPPGSTCSVTFGIGIPSGTPGSVHGLHFVVTDIVAARDELVGRGVDVSQPFHFSMTGQRSEGVDPNGADYATFAEFADPDGNTLLLQQVKGLPQHGTG